MDHHVPSIKAGSKGVTSITVHTDILEKLQERKTANQTWDEFLLALLEDYVPRAWVEELERRARDPVALDVPGDAVLRRSRAARHARAQV